MEQLAGVFLSVSWAPDRQERFGNASGRGLPTILIVSWDDGVEHFHRANYTVYVPLHTVLDINYLLKGTKCVSPFYR